jgi:hypothetical protein
MSLFFYKNNETLSRLDRQEQIRLMIAPLDNIVLSCKPVCKEGILGKNYRCAASDPGKEGFTDVTPGLI